MANGFKIPKIHLGDHKVPGEVLSVVPEESAIHYQFVPLAVRDGVLEIGILNPDNIQARDALNFISARVKMPFKLYLISQEDFDKVISMYKSLSEEVTKALTQLGPGSSKHDISFTLDEETAERVKEAEGKEKVKKGSKIIEVAPITKIVATILRYATEGNASDVHIERTKENVRVRFRVDGALHTSLALPAKVHSAVVARVKILSNMKLDEKRKPQDGRFSAKIEGRSIDFRVSTFPAFFGEKVVIRILDQEKGIRRLNDLGLSQSSLDKIRRAIKKPYGLILLSGPTGSGKTTTLYALLQEFDREKRNVLSLEDPVEYNIDGVSQSQVRPEIGYSFATGLRTTLRQDPDIIMVGEIRDSETAQLAIQAALTGHLVLATIHTNNAVGVIPRLIDMKVDPYLIAPTLVLAMAQRLVRRLCPGAGKEIPVEGSIKLSIEKQFADLPEEYRKKLPISKEVMRVSPSSECPSGTRGRMAVTEVFEMDKDIESAIIKDYSEQELGQLLRSKGMLWMKEDAILKAFSKLIPFEETANL
jgi:type IV pilus assembly protein PilB